MFDELQKAAAELKPQAKTWIVLENIKKAFEIVFYVIFECLRLSLLLGIVYLAYALVPWTEIIKQLNN